MNAFLDRLAVVTDLLLRYLHEKTALVGLFMMEKSCQGKGNGSTIMQECFGYLSSRGYRFVRLGFAKGNP